MSDTRDTIRERILDLIDDKYDKLPGSYIYEQSQAMAVELEDKYVEIEDAINQKFAGTADFENVKVIAYEKGVDWKDAEAASGLVKVYGIAGAVINEGDLFANELNQYAAAQSYTVPITGSIEVQVTCTTSGISGNTPANTIVNFPKTLTGINSVTNEAAFSNGYEAETRDELLDRYYTVVRKPATSGNAYHYEQWALAVDGVGAAKIKPLWNGNGTVKVVIIDRNKLPATQELITAAQTYIDANRPIGASVTVSTPESITVNIEATVQLKAGYTVEQVTADIQTKVAAYFKDATFTDSSVYYAKIGNIIFTADGVVNINYDTLKLNGAKNDIILIDDNTNTQIPSLGTVTIATA